MVEPVPYQQNPYNPRGSSNVIQCYRCGDTCKGEVVRVHNNHFHIRCFTCQVCGCGLAQSGFFFKNQEYICTQDYQQLYGTRCDSCRDFITGEVISALGRTYHPKCFVCSLCRKPFPIGDKVTFSGKECVCQTCSQSMTSSRPIKIRGPSRESSPGAPPCPPAVNPRAPCPGSVTGSCGPGGKWGRDGVPYCESDYHSQFGIKCETCDRYISGRVLEAGGKHYHPTCARCVRCHQMFTEGEEMYLTGSEVWHPICKQAARAEKKLKHRRTSETSISPPGSSIGSPNRVICDIYESLDLRQRRASSPGYIDSPTYSRQGMSPTFSRSPHHYYRSGDLSTATKSKTSEDISQASKYSPAYSPDPYYAAESEYWTYHGSPKVPRARRFSSGGEEDDFDRSMHKLQSGIGRLILKEEMKARSSSYSDPWTPPRSSTSSREALHTAGYDMSLNGSPRSHYLADSDPLISKSASLPAYRRNGLHRTPSADLFHYDSMNAVNWGMRGECHPVLGPTAALDALLVTVSSPSAKDHYRFWPYAGLWPNPEFPHSLSLPTPSLFPSSSLLLSSPWPLGDLQAICPIWVPRAIAECRRPSTARLDLPASPGGEGNSRSQMHIVPSEHSMSFMLSASDALPPASSNSYKRAQAGGRGCTKTREDSSGR
ncbi:actin binding lim protein member isoform [Lynx pardinus]|uniref:Actin binding lim protein member isoform n=1 Tax=Lynx pardinus TaxID=191816 RepID=A0A485NHT3_LYNPA|nr:actin binding lim protein member isoform [Lynx pardinus]